MAKLSEAAHIRNSHTGLATVASNAAADHKAEAERAGTDSPVGKTHTMIASFLTAVAAHEAKMLQECDQLGKADGLALVPDGVRGVLPMNLVPRSELFAKVFGELDATVTAVPRAGQPPLQQKPDVPLEFEHLVKVD